MICLLLAVLGSLGLIEVLVVVRLDLCWGLPKLVLHLGREPLGVQALDAQVGRLHLDCDLWCWLLAAWEARARSPLRSHLQRDDCR